MKKTCLAALISALVCGHAMAQAPTTAKDRARQAGIAIARQNFTDPHYIQETEQHGSGAIIAQRCLKAYPDDAALRQTCVMTAVVEDYNLFADTVKKAKGDAATPAAKPAPPTP